jgi:hypothetical protein
LGHLTRIVGRRWTYPPLCICNQEERTTYSEAFGLEERVEGDRGEEMSEEEGEPSATSPRRILVLRAPTPNIQIAGVSLRLKMVNQNSNLRLPMFHGIAKDDAK